MPKSILEQGLDSFKELVKYGDLGELLAILVVNNDIEIVQTKFENVIHDKNITCSILLAEAPFVKLIFFDTTKGNIEVERQIKKLGVVGLTISNEGVVSIYTNLDNIFAVNTNNTITLFQDIVKKDNPVFNDEDDVVKFIVGKILLNTEYIESIYQIVPESEKILLAVQHILENIENMQEDEQYNEY